MTVTTTDPLVDRPRDNTLADRDIVREALTEIGGLTGLLTSSDPAGRAHLYDSGGISGTYEPQVNRLILTTHPVGHVVRVGGMSCTITPRRD